MTQESLTNIVTTLILSVLRHLTFQFHEASILQLCPKLYTADHQKQMIFFHNTWCSAEYFWDIFLLRFGWLSTCPSANTYSLSNFSKILGKTFYLKIFQQNIAKLHISFCETNNFRQVQWLHINVIPPDFISGRKFQLIYN